MDERVEVLFNQGRFQMAYDLIKQLLISSPDNINLLGNLSMCCYFLKKYEEGIQIADDVISKDPHNALMFHQKAKIQALGLNDVKKGMDLNDIAIRLNPMLVAAHLFRARIMYYNMYYERAEESALEALEIDPTSARANLILSKIYDQTNKLDDSSQFLKRALELNPTDTYILSYKGFKALENGNIKKAEESFQQALHNDPSNFDAQRGSKFVLKAKFWPYTLVLRIKFLIDKYRERFEPIHFVVVLIVFSISINFLNYFGVLGRMVALCILGFTVTTLLFVWILDPLMTLSLFLNEKNTRLLTKKETQLSKFVVVQLVVIAMGTLLSIVLGKAWLYICGLGILGLIASEIIFRPTETDMKIIQIIAYTLCTIPWIYAIFAVIRNPDLNYQCSTIAILATFIYGFLSFSSRKKIKP